MVAQIKIFCRSHAAVLCANAFPLLCSWTGSVTAITVAITQILYLFSYILIDIHGGDFLFFTHVNLKDSLHVSRKKAAGVTRNEILDIAWDLIAVRGAEVSMKEIATASDVSRQSVYLHFNSRGGLLMALVKRADDLFTIKEDYFAAMAVKSPAKRLDQCLRIWFDFAIKIQPVASDLIRLRKTDEDAAAAWKDRMDDLWSWERRLIASLAAESALAKGWTINDATDFLWSLSSIQIWELFTGDRNWNVEKSSKILRKTIAHTLLA